MGNDICFVCSKVSHHITTDMRTKGVVDQDLALIAAYHMHFSSEQLLLCPENMNIYFCNFFLSKGHSIFRNYIRNSSRCSRNWLPFCPKYGGWKNHHACCKNCIKYSHVIDKHKIAQVITACLLKRARLGSRFAPYATWSRLNPVLKTLQIYPVLQIRTA